MANVLEMRKRGPAGKVDVGTERNALTTGTPPNPLDSDDARRQHRQLMEWFYYERDRQSANRLEMAVDHDFYDGQQWDPEDAAVLAARKQMPLVYNEVAPMADWLIGTERRNRVDWKVLPRTEDDVDLADVKTKVLKYVSDVNRSAFARSRAFADSIKGGLGWIDGGVNDDPTKEIIYDRWEDWRCVLHDSAAYDYDGEDGRYIFRWRWVDADIAALMFPDRVDKIQRAERDWATHFDPMADEQDWRTPLDGENGAVVRSGSLQPFSGYMADSKRVRIKLIECQYRRPARVKIVAAGPLKGLYYHERDTALTNALNRHGGSIIDKVAMRVHVAVFTEADLLAMNPSVYRHNRFSLTPIFCYRRNKDRQPYGIIRRVRDVQQDLNKRASKALWLLNTNQLIGDEGAVEDWDDAREEAQLPDGVIVKRAGKELKIQRDTDAATGQMQIMAMDAQSIQKSAGVNQENMGRQSNAVSGEAIKARQLQGSVSTTEPLDNLRFAVQCQGEKLLSLVEQFYSEEKVIRLTGAQGAIEWLRVNQPEVQDDGSVRFINDITASIADFQVAEQDYAGSLRQVMFDSLGQLAQKMPPEISLRVLTIALQFSDLPNKQEVTDAIRKITGERDPNKKLSPEEAQQQEEQMRQQAEALQMQRAQAQGVLEEQQAKVREINARADKLAAESQAMAAGGDDGGAAATLKMQMQVEDAVRQVREQAATQIDTLSRQLAQAQSDSATKTLQVNREADSKSLVAQIQADSNVRMAEINADSEKRLAAVLKRLDDMAKAVEDANKRADEANAAAAEAAKVAAAAEKSTVEASKVAAAAPPPAPVAASPAPAAPPAEPAPAQPPVVVMVQAPGPAAAPGADAPAKVQSFTVNKDKSGAITGATVKREDGTVDELKVRRDADGGIAGGTLNPTTPSKGAK